jgi:phospholipase/carboxylesterase
MGSFAVPSVALRGSTDPQAPLVVLLHGRGSHEQEIISLVEHLPAGPEYAAVRAPIAEGGGFAWFANRGIGRPVAASLAETMAWFRAWLDAVAAAGRPVVLLGFSGGAAFAGGLLLSLGVSLLTLRGTDAFTGTVEMRSGNRLLDGSSARA